MSNINNNPRKVNYRKIFEKHYGAIPKDENGRTYDIHHIDGNRHNNALNNLKAVSIQEHFDIHYLQGDWAACHRISARMAADPEVIKELGRRASAERVEAGTHNFLGGKIQSETNKRRIMSGDHQFLDRDGASRRAVERIINNNHHFLGDRNPCHKRIADGSHHFLGGDIQRANANRSVANGTHHFLGGAIHRRRVEDGSHPFLGGEMQRAYATERVANGTHHNFRQLECPHCGKLGKGSIMLRWHFDKCKHKP
jgi:hypothetical protein